eukprot:gene31304-37833_t
MELTIGKKYRLGMKLLYLDCQVYYGVDLKTGEDVFIKLEALRAHRNNLKREIAFYRIINGAYGTANFKWAGQEGDYDVLVLERLGPSLQDLFEYCGKLFTLKTVLMLAVQMIDRLAFVHSKHYIHRGVKPANFVMGTGSKTKVCHIIDFDLSSKYTTGFKYTKNHIPYSEGWQLTGNVIFASINNHLGIAQSRRDDIESLGYTLLYFLRGSLPWERLVNNQSRRQRNQRILESKQASMPERLCRGFPGEFKALFEYCAGLGFDKEPDYARLKKTFQDLFEARGFEDDAIYDWDIKKLESHLPRCSATMANQPTPPQDQHANMSNDESLSKTNGDEEGKVVIPPSDDDSTAPLAAHAPLPGHEADEEAASLQQAPVSTAGDAAAPYVVQPPLTEHRVEEEANLPATITENGPPLSAQPPLQEHQAVEAASTHQVLPSIADAVASVPPAVDEACNQAT